MDQDVLLDYLNNRILPGRARDVADMLDLNLKNYRPIYVSVTMTMGANQLVELENEALKQLASLAMSRGCYLVTDLSRSTVAYGGTSQPVVLITYIGLGWIKKD